MRKLRRALALGAAALAAREIGMARPVSAKGAFLDWDEMLPGTAAKGFSEVPDATRGPTGEEARIYVGNADCVSPPNSLVYDFADWPDGRTRGYAALALPAAAEGWTVLSFCFRKESGAASAELRGLYDRPGETFNGVARAWPFLWIALDDFLTVRAEGARRWDAVRVGAVLPGVWHRVSFRIPPPGSAGQAASATLERRKADGSFATVASERVPFGELVLRRVAAFDLTGTGPCRILFDDFAFAPETWYDPDASGSP